MADQDRSSAWASDAMRSTREHPETTSLLLASRDPGLVVRVRDALSEGGPHVRLVGVVDPTIERTLVIWQGEADVLMIGSDELLQLLRRDGSLERQLADWFCLVSLTRPQHVLELVSALGCGIRILFCDREGALQFAAIEMALNGYLVIPSGLLQQLTRDQLRLDIVRRLSSNERAVLRCLAEALPNETIAARTGLSHARVRSMTTRLIRKLHVRNRTALAVFAACHRSVAARR